MGATGTTLSCVVCTSAIAESRKLGSIFCSAKCDTICQRGKKYGLTPKQAHALLFEARPCDICSTAMGEHIDHNHDTGEVRGLLCSGCNTGLGMFRDSIHNLSSAVDYLMRNGSYGLGNIQAEVNPAVELAST